MNSSCRFTLNSYAHTLLQVVVIAGKDEMSLRIMNSQMRRIDMICKLLGPLFIASVDSVSTSASIVMIFAMNVSSLLIEYYAIARVYYDIPELQDSKRKEPLPVFKPSDCLPSNRDSTLKSEISATGKANHLTTFRKAFLRDNSFYFQHGVSFPSLAGVFLNLTVLSFGGQMITYLLSSGYSPTQVGFARNFGVVLEISATWLAPWLIGLVGAVRTGLWMSIWQLTMLVAGTMVFF
jgi:iron-regulated transporter 1